MGSLRATFSVALVIHASLASQSVASLHEGNILRAWQDPDLEIGDEVIATTDASTALLKIINDRMPNGRITIVTNHSGIQSLQRIDRGQDNAVYLYSGYDLKAQTGFLEITEHSQFTFSKPITNLTSTGTLLGGIYSSANKELYTLDITNSVMFWRTCNPGAPTTGTWSAVPLNLGAAGNLEKSALLFINEAGGTTTLALNPADRSHERLLISASGSGAFNVTSVGSGDTDFAIDVIYYIRLSNNDSRLRATRPFANGFLRDRWEPNRYSRHTSFRGCKPHRRHRGRRHRRRRFTKLGRRGRV